MHLGLGLGVPQQRGVAPVYRPDYYAARWGLQAYWNLSDLSDAYGASTLTNNGGVTFVPGKVGNAANFVATQTLSNAGNAALVSNGGDIWVAGWVHPATTGAQILAVKAGDSPPFNIDWAVSISGAGRVVFRHRFPSNSAVTLAAGVWTFFMGYFNQGIGNAGTILVSINGGAFSTLSNSSSVTESASSPLQFGADLDGTTNPFTGMLDSFAFGRLAPGGILVPTATEIRDKLYNGGVGITWPNIT